MLSLRENKDEEAESYARQALEADAGNAYAYDVLGLVYAGLGRRALALEHLEQFALGQALRLAPGEAFIRKHYLQVRALYIESARLEDIQKKETSNEKTD